MRIANGRTDLVFDFIAGGGATDASDDDGVPILRRCAYYGDVSAIRYLIGQGASLALLGDNLDLNGVAFHGHWRLCAFLIEAGADPNHALPDSGETPLHAATSVANRPAHDLVVRVLLAAGADPDARTREGAATGAFMRDSRTRGETPLHRAAAFASLETVEALIAAGAEVAARDAHGDTPLSWASWHQRPSDILRALCHGEHRLHPDAHWTGDHGAGWRSMDRHLLGKP